MTVSGPISGSIPLCHVSHTDFQRLRSSLVSMASQIPRAMRSRGRFLANSRSSSGPLSKPLPSCQVSKAGSVKVEALMKIERYSHVMHISSTVTGELKDDLTSWDALKATLPVGTVSGAPKVRAFFAFHTAMETHCDGLFASMVIEGTNLAPLLWSLRLLSFTISSPYWTYLSDALGDPCLGALL